MEILLVIGLLVVLYAIVSGGSLWLWVALLVISSVAGARAYSKRCKACGKGLISGRKMKFCNQCGVEQKRGRGFRLRCEACHSFTRSELNMAYCNHCGAAATP